MTESFGNTVPVGFEGVLTMIALVFGVMRDLISSMSGRKPFSWRREYSTGVPPARDTSGPYTMNPGFGTSTSSPLSTIVLQAIIMPSVAPAVTMMFSNSTSFLKRFRLLAIASRSSFTPALGPYLLYPLSSAALYASIISRGGWMSGSPRPRLMASGGAASKSFLIPETFSDATRDGNIVVMMYIFGH